MDRDDDRDQAMERTELSTAEREGLAALPRERIPPPGLEHRTLGLLRERGLLRRRSISWGYDRVWIAAAAAAAGVALFLGGVSVGQLLGARQTAQALSAFYPDMAERAAARVQSTGTAHAEALDALVQAALTADPREREQAREVARATLWAAAAEVVRLAPDDPLAVRILQEFERARGVGPAQPDSVARSVIWF